MAQVNLEAQVTLVTLEALVMMLMQLLRATTGQQQQPVGLTDCLLAL